MRVDFAISCIHVNKQKNWKTKTLSVYSEEDFRPFTEDKFATLPSIINRNFRDTLREQEVYFKKGGYVVIAKSLRQAVEIEKLFQILFQ